MKIINKENNAVIVGKAILANSFFKRLTGLLGKDKLEDEEGLVIFPCNSVHTFFMRFAIDVLFVDSANKIVGISNNLMPWRITKIYWNARFVIELPSGRIKNLAVNIGDTITLG